MNKVPGDENSVSGHNEEFIGQSLTKQEEVMRDKPIDESNQRINKRF